MKTNCTKYKEDKKAILWESKTSSYTKKYFKKQQMMNLCVWSDVESFGGN